MAGVPDARDFDQVARFIDPEENEKPGWMEDAPVIWLPANGDTAMGEIP